MPEQERGITFECVSEKDKRKLNDNTEDIGDEVTVKKPKLSKSEKKKLRGQNKSRGPTVIQDRRKELCNSQINITKEAPKCKCSRNKCNFLHDAEIYLKIKPKDIG